VDYAKLRERLLADKQVLEWTGPRPPTGIDPKSLPGLVLDDDQAEKRGDWSRSTSIGGFVGAAYLHDNNGQKGQLSATYRFTLKEPGTYEVRVAYTPNPNRATNVPVTIEHASGKSRVMLNQKKSPTIDKLFQPLGKFEFDKQAVITIGTEDTDGYVVIDAVQLVPAGAK
jgi:hypothetical protein